MNGLTFDLTKLTVAEFPGRKRGSLSDQSRIMPLVVTACPAEWGDPQDMKTWQKLNVRTLGRVFGEYNAAVRAAVDNNPPVGWSLELSEMSAEDYDLVEAVSLRDTHPAPEKTTIRLLTRYVVGAPVDGYAKAETYEGLAYYTQFLPLAKKLWEESQKEIANFRSAALSAPEVQAADIG
jgi:hypothetical protein